MFRIDLKDKEQQGNPLQDIVILIHSYKMTA